MGFNIIITFQGWKEGELHIAVLHMPDSFQSKKRTAIEPCSWVPIVVNSLTVCDPELNFTTPLGICMLSILVCIIKLFITQRIQTATELGDFSPYLDDGWERRSEPSNGVFPLGCKWRKILRQKADHAWAKQELEYWDSDTAQWRLEIPLACTIGGHEPDAE